MKTTILKPVFTLSAVAFAVFAAFAFSTAPQKAAVIDIWGLNPLEDCDVTTVRCTTTEGPVCTQGVGGTQLYNMNSAQTACNVELYRKQN